MAAMGLPAPGKIPIKLPIAEERNKCKGCAITFLMVLKVSPPLGLCSAINSIFLSSVTMDSTCGIAKIPIRPATRDTPPRSSGTPKVNRASSFPWLIPTQLIKSPIAPPASPFRIESPAKLPMIVNAKIPSQKNSGGPNLSAISIKGQANTK